MVVGVLVELSNKNIDRVFDYKVPNDLIDKVKVGVRVSVPFGKMTIDGFILEIKEDSDRELKEILLIKDEDIILNDELLSELPDYYNNINDLLSKYYYHYYTIKI